VLEEAHINGPVQISDRLAAAVVRCPVNDRDIPGHRIGVICFEDPKIRELYPDRDGGVQRRLGVLTGENPVDTMMHSLISKHNV
jgi:hypothetical protein